MTNDLNHSIKLTSYDQIYLSRIRPRLSSLDLFLKENHAPFNVYEVADILEMDLSELQFLMKKLEINEINETAFFSLVHHASSDICGYIRRQWKYSKTTYYTPQIISEIYKLNLHKVECAFAELNTSLVTDAQLIDVFKRIHLTSFASRAT